MAAGFFRTVLGPLLAPVFRPVMRRITQFIVGVLAIPLFRLFRRRVVKLQEFDQELEKDIDEWFRAALLLLLATQNVEESLANFLSFEFDIDITKWIVFGGRLLLAIGVVEAMPDQELFAIIHPGPPRLRYDKALGLWGSCREQFRPFMWGLFCKYISRSSPMFAIMCAIQDGTVGWVCYVLAVIQYLFIGLITSRDKALSVLSEFDRQVAIRREELVREFDESRNPAVPGPSEPTREEDPADKEAIVKKPAAKEPTAKEAIPPGQRSESDVKE